MDTFLADLGSARLSADMDRNSGGLTASSVAAIVALVASSIWCRTCPLLPSYLRYRPTRRKLRAILLEQRI